MSGCGCNAGASVGMGPWVVLSLRCTTHMGLKWWLNMCVGMWPSFDQAPLH